MNKTTTTNTPADAGLASISTGGAYEMRDGKPVLVQEPTAPAAPGPAARPATGTEAEAGPGAATGVAGGEPPARAEALTREP